MLKFWHSHVAREVWTLTQPFQTFDSLTFLTTVMLFDGCPLSLILVHEMHLTKL